MPRLKLTKTAIDTAAPGTRDYEIRDTAIPGFLLKVTPAGRKTFMIAYTAANGQRRKPAIGRFGEITAEQARSIAQDWLADVRKGRDPSAERDIARRSPTIKDLCDRFIKEYAVPRNKASTVSHHRTTIKVHVVPAMGLMKAPDVTRADVASLIGKMEATPVAANQTLRFLSKMFNMAEVWGVRPDGSNPTRHVPKFPERGRTRLITDDELRRLYAYLDEADRDGLEHPLLTLGIRLQFAFAARRSEITGLRWEWIDFVKRRVVWPDSKTGGISKPLSQEAFDLLAAAPRFSGSPFVVPALFDPTKPMPDHTYSGGWTRILARAGLVHCGTHAVRHRAATDIANSGVPTKVGMALTAHKTVTMFMRYVHVEDEPIRAAAETVAARRKLLTSVGPDATQTIAGLLPAPDAISPPPIAAQRLLAAYRPPRNRPGWQTRPTTKKGWKGNV